MWRVTPVQFEEFVYDLLSEMGFRNLSWRKGTALPGGSSDSGRDIEASLARRDVDGAETIERWFFECKHHKKGVPPAALEGAFAWASAEKPDVLVFAVSGFLSNPAKDNLDKRRKAPLPYKTKVWEQKDLDRLAQPFAGLRTKYGLPTEVPFLSLVHRNHLLYALKPQLSSTEYLLECMANMEPEFREKVFGTVFLYTINPRTRKPKSPDESFNDILLDEVSFEAFCTMCREESRYWHSPSFARNAVSESLAWMLHSSDDTDLPRVRKLYRDNIDLSRRALSIYSPRVRKG